MIKTIKEKGCTLFQTTVAKGSANAVTVTIVPGVFGLCCPLLDLFRTLTQAGAGVKHLIGVCFEAAASVGALTHPVIQLFHSCATSGPLPLACVSCSEHNDSVS